MSNITCDINPKIQIINNEKIILPLKILPQSLSSPQRQPLLSIYWLPSRAILYICTSMFCVFLCIFKIQMAVVCYSFVFFHLFIRPLYVYTYRICFILFLISTITQDELTVALITDKTRLFSSCCYYKQCCNYFPCIYFIS